MENNQSESVKGDSIPDDVTQPTTKVTKSMQDILKDLVEKRMLLDEQEMTLTFSAGDVDSNYAKNMEVENFHTPTDDLKLFASFLHWYAPEAYDYVRGNYITPLPEIKVLAKWCENDKFEAGFTKQAFDMLEKKSAENGKRLKCSIVTHKHQLFVCKSFVAIDVGRGSLGTDEDYENESREAFIILLVGVEETWKIPAGYFLPDHTPRQTEASIIKMVLHSCHEFGVDIVSVTATPETARFLGCNFDQKDSQSSFKHPASGNLVTTYLDSLRSPYSRQHAIDPKNEFFKAQKAMKELISVFLKRDPGQHGGKFAKIYKTVFKDLASNVTSGKKSNVPELEEKYPKKQSQDFNFTAAH